MDKKALNVVVEEIITDVATKNNLQESEARTLVGIMLRKSKDAIAAAAVSPTLGLVSLPDQH